MTNCALDEVAAIVEIAGRGFTILSYEGDPASTKRMLEERLPGVLFFDVDLRSTDMYKTVPSAMIAGAYESMRSELAGKGYSKGVLSVFGLERTYMDEKPRGGRPRSLSNINMVRDRYWFGQECHTLFWIMGRDEVDFIAMNAPDFFSRRSGVYDV